jgi:hypothetical protein
MKRKTVAAYVALMFMSGADSLAQDASPSGSAATKAKPPARDFEAQPPSERGTKLDPANGWSDAPRPMLLRPFAVTHAKVLASPESCELGVQGDWLRLYCKGQVGRVNQLAGDPGEAVVHISNQQDPDGKGGFIDKRRLLLFVRLVPGAVSIFEITGVGSGYDSDWEGLQSLVSVDWSDTGRGPRILVHPELPGYAF